MKKFLTIVLSAVFVFGLAATAFAIHAEIPSETQSVVAKGTTQITLGGSIRIRGEMKKNTSDFDSDKDDSVSAYDQRIRLSLDAKVSDNVQGYVMLESGANTTDVATWGANGSAAKGIYGPDSGGVNTGNAKQGTLAVNEGWLLWKGAAGLPVGLKVGHMPLSLGNKLFFDHTKLGDDAIVVFADPAKEVHVGVLTVKFREGSTGNSNDADAYVGLVTYKTDMFGAGLNLTNVHDQTLGGTTTSEDKTNLYNLGLTGDVKVGPAAIKADVELQSGKISHATGTPENKFKGYALLLGASMNIDAISLGIEGAMGSGDKATSTSNDIKSFVTSLGADKHFTYVYDYRTPNACGYTSGGLCNTTYVKLNAGTKMGALAANLDLYWLQTTADVYNGAPVPELTKDLGIEIDAKVSYALAKNLSYWVEGGYFIVGDAYKTTDSVTGLAQDGDNAYALRHGIELNF